MKKTKFTKALSLLTAAALITTSVASMGVSSFASTNVTLLDNLKGLDIVKGQKTTEKAYTDGEAIVLLKSSTSKKVSGMSVSQADKSLNFAGDITVEKKFNFGSYKEDAEKGGVATASSKKTNVVNVEVLKVSSKKKSTKDLIKELKADKRVKAAMPNMKIKCKSLTNDTYSDQQWGLEKIEANSMWEGNDGVTGTEKVIAVVDTGVDYTHEDLKDNMWRNTSTKLAGRYGYDFVNNDSDPMDDYGHGTHCAGIIGAAGNNGKGISGVNQNAKIMALKFLDEDGSGEVDGAVGAYEYISKAQDLGVDVVAINNSWGGSVSIAADDDDYDEYEMDESDIFGALMNITGSKGAVSVWAAGNDSVNIDQNGGGTLYDGSEYSIGVGALAENNKLAGFSNRGAKSVDIASPGAAILSTVPSYTFNPSMYPAEEKNRICGTFKGFEEASEVPSEEDIQILTKDGSKCKVTLEKSDSVKFRGGSSLEMKVEKSVKGEAFAVGIPYNTGNAETPRVSMMVSSSADFEDFNFGYVCMFDEKGEASLDDLAGKSEIDPWIGAIPDYIAGLYNQSDNWAHIDMKTSGKANEDRYIYYVFMPDKSGDYSLFIDDFGVSSGDATTEDFGKYDFMSGTSMATPFVTGAVALTEAWMSDASDAEITKGDKALAVKEAVLANAKQEEGLKSEIAEGRVLNLNSVKASPAIKSVSVDSNKNLVVKGKGFANATGVKVNNTDLTQKATIKATTVTIPAAAYMNKQVTVKIENAAGASKKTTIAFYNKKDYTGKGLNLNQYADADSAPVLFSNGSSVFAASVVQGTVAIDKYSSARNMFDAYIEGSASVDEDGDISGSDATVSIIGKPVVCDDKVYLLQKTYEKSMSGTEFASDTRLVAYNLKENGNKVIDRSLPAAYDSIEGCTLGAYNGKIYLAGGYNLKTEKTSNAVYKYDPATKKWSKSASLPAGKYGGSMAQSGNELVYAFGADESGKVPKNMIFNGTSWETSSKQLTGLNYEEETVDGKVFKNYNGSINVISGGVVMTGVVMNGYGDTVKYNVSKDSYTASDLEFIRSIKTDSLDATTAGSYIYGLGINGYGVDLYKNKLSNGCVKASGTFKNGKVVNANKYVLPGNMIKLKATPSKGCYLKSFKVDGKTVKGNTKSVRLTKNIKVSATFGKYVSKITLNKKSAKVAAGKTVKLKAKVSPSSATNKAVSWSSSNTKYATVTSKGLVKAKTAGKGKTVKITVKAKDGSGKKATCKVTIKK